MKNKNIIIVGIVALIVGVAGGFFGGMKYAESKTPARGQFAANFQGGNAASARAGGRFAGGANANGMAVRGQVISADNNSITVKMPDGSTKIVILGSSTTIAKTATGSATDLTNGTDVTAFGTPNSDGSITATNVQIGNGMMFGPRPSGSPASNQTTDN